jgi:hypothetical protein
MKSVFDFFLILVVIMKVAYLVSETVLGIYKHRKTINNETLQKLEYYNEQMYIISQIGMFLLLAIIFRPGGNKQVVVDYHEKLIFFSIGIIGLTHIQYRQLFKK